MKQRVLFTAGLMISLCIVWTSFNRVFCFKYDDGLRQMTSFYELGDNTVDVLVLGSSHAFVNILPEEMWSKKKIAAYNLCGSIAPLWNSYYDLIEASKYQKPKLVILEAFCLTEDIDYSYYSSMIKNVYGMKNSKVKRENIKASIPKEAWIDYGIEPLQYHGRYKDLSSEDYANYYNNPQKYKYWLGNCFFDNIVSFENPNVINDGVKKKIPEKQCNYYRKIIEYCKQNNQELLVIVTPYPGYNMADASIFNSAKEIAEDEGIRFVNFNEYTEQIGTNWETDYVDRAHMSYIGSSRFTGYLSDYICENFSIESHNKDEQVYDRWNKASQYFDRQSFNSSFKRIIDINTYADKMSYLDDTYTIVVKFDKPFYWIDEYPELEQLLYDKWCIQSIDNELEEPKVWIVDEFGAKSYQKSKYGYNWARRYGKKELVVSNSGIYYERENVENGTDGLSIVIFDSITESIVDSVMITQLDIVR